MWRYIRPPKVSMHDLLEQLPEGARLTTNAQGLLVPYAELGRTAEDYIAALEGAVNDKIARMERFLREQRRWLAREDGRALARLSTYRYSALWRLREEGEGR